MRTASPTTSSRFPALNLLVLRTDVDRRFALLIFAIFSTSLYIFHTETVTLFLEPSLSSCLTQSVSAPEALVVSGLNYSCVWQPDLFMLLGLLVGELLMFGVGFVIYWLYPACLSIWRGYESLPEDVYANVLNYLHTLPQEYRRSLDLHYVWNASRSGSPRIFGRWRAHTLFLPYGFLNLFNKAAQNGSLDLSKVEARRFHTKMLHELAHLYNRDVDRYYLMRSLLYAFGGICALPFAFFLVWSLFHLQEKNSESVLFIGSNVALSLLFLLQIRLIYCSLLRSREVYADIQATQWADSPGDMEDALDSLGDQKRRVPILGAIFDVHPPKEERKQSIAERQRIFRLRFWEVFGIGVVLGLAFLSLRDIFSVLGQLLTIRIFQVNYPVLYPDPGTLLLCLFAAFIIGQMIWGATVVQRLEKKPLRNTGWLGLCLALGLLLGVLVSLYLTPIVVFYHLNSAQILFSYLLPWLLFLILCSSGFCAWVALAASLWLETVSTEKAFRRISRVSFVLAGLLLAMGVGEFWLCFETALGYLLLGHNPVDLTHPLVLQPAANAAFYWRLMLQVCFGELLPGYGATSAFLPSNPFWGGCLNCLALACLWAWPLASWLWYRQKKALQQYQWAIDPADSTWQSTSVVPAYPFRLRRVVLVALIGSLLFCLLIFPLRLRMGMPATAVGAAGYALLIGPLLLPLIIGPFLLAAFFQACIAASIAALIRPFGAIHGLFGAFLGGCMMSIGSMIVYDVFGGLKPGGIAFLFFYEVNWGAACALSAVLVMALLKVRLPVRPFLQHVLPLGLYVRLKRSLPLRVVCILLLGVIVFLPFLMKPISGSQSSAITNLVQDGDFEEPILLDAVEEYDVNQSLGGWVVSSGSVALVGSSWIPAHGTQSLDLASSAPGIIYQDLSTRHAANYTLSFEMAGDPECPVSTMTQMQVWWGSTTVALLSFPIAGNSQPFVKWQPYTYKVRASGTTTRLSFISLAPPPCGPTLDNVSVEG